MTEDNWLALSIIGGLVSLAICILIGVCYDSSQETERARLGCPAEKVQVSK